ncbi:MAG: 2Fe-2S iron-sulfur cluster binding domain-containing protein [Limnohabitans sp.]|nr:MAG: 2Fe-2S iron-sulfur cluster binding domain-containing protein [Limnohabitans sp.]
MSDGTFEIHLAKRNITLTVQPDQSILKVLQDAGVDVPFSCSEGICGTCLTKVKEGEPDHWDMYLTPEEQEKGDCIMVCISRSKSPRLVLDL